MKKIFVLIFTLVLLAVAAVPASAVSENTTYTYTLSVNGEWIRTQDAYMPGKILLKEIGLLHPSDLFVKGSEIYVADTENKRVVKYNISTEQVEYIVTPDFVSPTGLFVSDDKTLYVADSGAGAVIALKDGKQIMKITKPESNLFAKGSDFKPKNVAVSSQGNIFVCGTGVSEGIMRFDMKGEFQGYFAANKNTLSLTERLKDLFYTKEQKEAAVARTARPIENIDITDNDLIYSVTQSASFSLLGVQLDKSGANAVKLHNMAGNNIFSKTEKMMDENNFVDVVSAPQGRCYALTYTGLINEYDKNGDLIFSFGGRGVSFDRAGMFTLAAAIDIDDNGIVYVLDGERGIVQSFIPTEFSFITYQAIESLNAGRYEESGEIWKNLIRMNAMSRIAHLGYGKTLYHTGHFEEALEEFKTANDKEYYSDCFWEIRDNWLHDNMVYIIIAVILLLVLKLVGIGKLIRKWFKIPLKEEHGKSGIGKVFKDMTVFIKHPIDTVYDLKKGYMGNALIATCIYIAAVAVYMLDMIGRGFIFSVVDTQKTAPATLVAALVIPFALWIIGSTLISSINSGEGAIKKVYIVNAYALLPYIIGALVLIVLSYVLTNNEGFIVNYGWTAIIIWTAVNIFNCNRELQNYSFGENVKNTLLTFFFMIMAIAAIVILVILGSQLTNFVQTLINEVIYRVGQ